MRKSNVRKQDMGHTPGVASGFAVTPRSGCRRKQSCCTGSHPSARWLHADLAVCKSYGPGIMACVACGSGLDWSVTGAEIEGDLSQTAKLTEQSARHGKAHPGGCSSSNKKARHQIWKHVPVPPPSHHGDKPSRCTSVGTLVFSEG